MEASELQDTIYDVVNSGRKQGLLHRHVADEPLDGRHIVLDGQSMVSFGSCSYLGLEVDPRLREGVIRAAGRYGSQFSASRAYLSAPPYAALEEQLSALFGRPALMSSSTTLAHIGALPVLCQEKDAIILDQQVHHSVQLGATLARAAGCHVELVRHGDVAELERRVAELSRSHRRVWHLIDGVYSMYGDLPDVAEMGRLLNRYEQLHLYVDDAHGMSLAGEHGRGIHLSRMPWHERMVVATSLNKAFACSGGVLILPTAEMRDRVRICGSTFMFCGPIQPPMLGAIGACVGIHMSDEIGILQTNLRERIHHLTAELLKRDLPLLEQNDAPIFFVKTGPLKMAHNLLRRIQGDGYYVSAASYPAVPLKRSGLRISVTNHHQLADLTGLAESIARHYPAALEETELTREDVEGLFSYRDRLAIKNRHRQLSHAFELGTEVAPRPALPPPSLVRASLQLQTATSIRELDAGEWDLLLGQRSTFNAAGLAALEDTFRNRSQPENNWAFHYFIVRANGRPVAATFFTEALWKDDMLMRAEVSRRVEERRVGDPYFLTSRAMAMGSQLTEGDHLYLDREGPWREALGLLVEEASQRMQAGQGKLLVLRDLPGGDPGLDEVMLDLGLVKMPMPDGHSLDLTTFTDEATFLEGLNRRARKRVRDEVIEPAPHFRTRIYRAGGESPTAAQFAHFHQLYRQVKVRKLRLNTFDLPSDIFQRLFETPGWELLTLQLAPEVGGPADGREVAVAASCANGPIFVGLVCGIDTADREISVYRQMLWQVTLRAKALGHKELVLGMGAEYEKLRLGAVARPQCAYVQLTDHFGAELLGQVVQDVALKPADIRQTG